MPMPTAEETVYFSAGGACQLEGRLRRASSAAAVIITHPHPLYGGDLDNPVVATLTRLYQQRDYTTLRFNFRGVGDSSGMYDDGRGEREDLRAAAVYLDEQGQTVTDLAGYSFGAWINLLLNPPLTTVRRQLLVAPPVAFLTFGVPPSTVAELLIVVGDCDAFAPLALLRKQASCWRPTPRLRVLPGVDHFYSHALDRLAAQVESLLVDSDWAVSGKPTD